MQDLHVETFAAHLNERFTVVHDGARSELTLIEASPRRAGRPGMRPPFALLFHGPPAPALPQATYRFEHAVLPPLDIFIVPIGPEGEHMRYEAIFA